MEVLSQNRALQRIEHLTERSTSQIGTPHRTGHLTEWPQLSLLLYTLPCMSHCTHTEVLLNAQCRSQCMPKPHHTTASMHTPQPHSTSPCSLLHRQTMALLYTLPQPCCTPLCSLTEYNTILWPHCIQPHSLTAYNPTASLHTTPQPHCTSHYDLTAQTMVSVTLSHSLHCTPPEASLNTTLQHYCTSPTASLHTTLTSHCNPSHNLSTPSHSLLHTILKPSCLIMNHTVISLHTTHSLTAHQHRVLAIYHSIEPPQVGRRNILLRPSLLGP